MGADGAQTARTVLVTGAGGGPGAVMVRLHGIINNAGIGSRLVSGTRVQSRRAGWPEPAGDVVWSASAQESQPGGRPA